MMAILLDILSVLGLAGFGLVVISEIDFGDRADVSISIGCLALIAWMIFRLLPWVAP
jgi:hypothetical protein